MTVLIAIVCIIHTTAFCKEFTNKIISHMKQKSQNKQEEHHIAHFPLSITAGGKSDKKDIVEDIFSKLD